MGNLVKFFVSVFMTFMLVGCVDGLNGTDLPPKNNNSQITNQSNQCETFQFKDMQIDFSQGTYMYKNWGDPVGTYQGAAIADRKTAVSVAMAIFDGMKNGQIEAEYVPKSVFYDMQDKIWIISFGKPIDASSQVFMVGGGISIALRESDGAVLRIWGGE